MVMHLSLGRKQYILPRGIHILPQQHIKYGGKVKMFDKELTGPVVAGAFRDVGRDMLGRNGRGQKQGSGVSSGAVISRRPLVFKK